MAWETRRNGNRYFYQVWRDANGKVRKTYLGNGAAAEAAALELARGRARCAAERAKANALRQQLDPAATLLDQLGAGLDALVEAVLRSQGLDQHRGEWRRHHGK